MAIQVDCRLDLPQQSGLAELTCNCQARISSRNCGHIRGRFCVGSLRRF